MLEVDGKQYDALIKDIQYNAMARRVDEIDFQALVSNEKVHSVAEVILVNAEKVASGVVQEGLSEIAYKALPAALVDKVKVDVGNMKVGDTIRVKDLEIATKGNSAAAHLSGRCAPRLVCSYCSRKPSGRFDLPLPFMQFLRHVLIILRIKYHKINKSAYQTKKHESRT